MNTYLTLTRPDVTPAQALPPIDYTSHETVAASLAARQAAMASTRPTKRTTRTYAEVAAETRKRMGSMVGSWSMEPAKTNKRALDLLDLVKAQPDQTAKHYGDILGIKHHTVTSYMTNLRMAGYQVVGTQEARNKKKTYRIGAGE